MAGWYLLLLPQRRELPQESSRVYLICLCIMALACFISMIGSWLGWWGCGGLNLKC